MASSKDAPIRVTISHAEIRPRNSERSFPLRFRIYSRREQLCPESGIRISIQTTGSTTPVLISRSPFVDHKKFRGPSVLPLDPSSRSIREAVRSWKNFPCGQKKQVFAEHLWAAAAGSGGKATLMDLVVRHLQFRSASLSKLLYHSTPPPGVRPIGQTGAVRSRPITCESSRREQIKFSSEPPPASLRASFTTGGCEVGRRVPQPMQVDALEVI